MIEHWIDLRVGYQCNNQCRFCDQGRARDRLQDASTAAVLAALPECVGQGTGLWLVGGEVTLRPDLPTIIRGARSAGFARVGLQSNGRILAAPLAAGGLRAAGLSDVGVSLHAPVADLHDYLVGVPGAFRQTVQGIRRLVAAGLRVTLAVVISRSVGPSLPEMARLAISLGVQGCRLIVLREQGAALQDARALVPRFRLLEEFLGEALGILSAAGIAVETFGVPLCVLPVRAVAGDRLDEPLRPRVGLMGAEAVPPRAKGPPCQNCRLADICAGPDVAYTQRWGWDEFVAVGAVGAEIGASTLAAPPRGGRPVATMPQFARGWAGGDPVPVAPALALSDPLFLSVGVPCSRGCASCATREAAQGRWQKESGRSLRQVLVRAAGEGVRGVIFGGASPWEHEALPELVREAVRLGLGPVEVWGPLYPLAELSAGTAAKLEGLTRVRVPVLPDAVAGAGTKAASEAASVLLSQFLPNCAQEALLGGELPSFYRAEGWRGVWGSCMAAVNNL